MPLNPRLVVITASQNGHRLGSTQLDAGLLVQGQEVADRFGRPERLDGFGGDVRGRWRAVRPERCGGQPVGVEPHGAHRVEPSVLDGVDPFAATGAENGVAVGAGRPRLDPGHRARALPREPVAGRTGRVDGPHEGVRLPRGGGDVRREPRDGRILREVQHLSRIRPHRRLRSSSLL
jgi:hypothetical protein